MLSAIRIRSDQSPVVVFPMLRKTGAEGSFRLEVASSTAFSLRGGKTDYSLPLNALGASASGGAVPSKKLTGQIQKLTGETQKLTGETQKLSKAAAGGNPGGRGRRRGYPLEELSDAVEEAEGDVEGEGTPSTPNPEP